MRKRRPNVAVAGATGAVGTEMLRVLEERHFPVNRIRLLASPRSAGRRISFCGSAHKVELLQARSFEGIDLALFSAGASRSLQFAPEAVRRGAVVVDNSSAFRMKPDVPLVVPEVNADALKRHKGIIANPNCSTIIMVVPLAALHKIARIKRIIVATYQSVSGAGAKAMAQLDEEARALVSRFRVSRSKMAVNAKLSDKDRGIFRALPGQIGFNLIPQIDVFLKNLYTKEEMKMVNETRKILSAPELLVSATCIRVPVFIGHSEAVWIETEKRLSVARAQQILRKATGVKLFDAPARGLYPVPIDSVGGDEVLIGRIRKDESIANGLALWICGDNLRKGAATNAVQIAECLVKSGKW